MPTTRRNFLAAFIATTAVFATARTAVALDVWVEGKYRRDGVYVPGHYRSGRDPRAIDDTKPNPIPRDERRGGGLYDGADGFGRKAVFGNGNKGGNPRGRRLGD
ncbi:MAG: hypothetical protein O3C65_07855 [Proteobacteria bacterium]|nr:hypothetical protein [Pseudomonadota bacterium]MDA1058587.1 hypothetical protein [Pseudomonadota bacterium]